MHKAQGTIHELVGSWAGLFLNSALSIVHCALCIASVSSMFSRPLLTSQPNRLSAAAIHVFQLDRFLADRDDAILAEEDLTLLPI